MINLDMFYCVLKMNGRGKCFLIRKKIVLKIRIKLLNNCSHAVRVGLKTGIERGAKDSRVRSIVIIGKGQTFPAGADIREFGKPSKGIKCRIVQLKNVLNSTVTESSVLGPKNEPIVVFVQKKNFKKYNACS